ncbi:MAG: hypothetical protein A2Y66_01820 [Nitrospirae bacterium RBG_13_41_22]|nr:MAG: hypothetical protein A2Y66_01820 [Nitrospirae bacterium RBG_13_41_22]
MRIKVETGSDHKTPLMKSLGVSLNEFRFLDEKKRRAIIKKCFDNGEIRCFFCGRILFTGLLGNQSNIEAKCHYPRCKKINHIYITN